MKTVKTFGNLSEAGFASSLLEAAGIPASLAGEQSALYTPGMATAGIRLEVEDQDFDRALRVLEEGPDAPERSVAPAPSEASESAGKIPVGLFGAVALGLALLFFAIHQWQEERGRQAMRADLQTYEEDYNHDRKPDHFYTYRNGRMFKSEADRNFDGKIDAWEFFDAEGRIERAEFDQNFDGKPDVWYFYEGGQVKRSERDADFNGQPDWFGVYENGLEVRLDCRPNGSKIVVRREVYERSILHEEWVDEDQDGKFDYKILHDPFGATSERLPIEQAK